MFPSSPFFAFIDSNIPCFPHFHRENSLHDSKQHISIWERLQFIVEGKIHSFQFAQTIAFLSHERKQSKSNYLQHALSAHNFLIPFSPVKQNFTPEKYLRSIIEMKTISPLFTSTRVFVLFFFLFYYIIH